MNLQEMHKPETLRSISKWFERVNGQAVFPGKDLGRTCSKQLVA